MLLLSEDSPCEPHRCHPMIAEACPPRRWGCAKGTPFQLLFPNPLGVELHPSMLATHKTQVTFLFRQICCLEEATFSGLRCQQSFLQNHFFFSPGPSPVGWAAGQSCCWFSSDHLCPFPQLLVSLTHHPSCVRSELQCGKQTNVISVSSEFPWGTSEP